MQDEAWPVFLLQEMQNLLIKHIFKHKNRYCIC